MKGRKEVLHGNPATCPYFLCVCVCVCACTCVCVYVCMYVCNCSQYHNTFFFFFLISHQFYTHHCIHVNPNRPIQHITIPTPPQFSPHGVHTFVLYICVSTSALQPSSSVPFFLRFHIYVLAYCICFSLSDLLHSV